MALNGPDWQMEEAHVARLRAEFDGCDSTSSGFLGRDELTTLTQRLHLQEHLPHLQERLLGPRGDRQVNFEQFKDGFVAVLSRSLDFSTSEDDSSYLEPEQQQQEEALEGALGSKVSSDVSFLCTSASPVSSALHRERSFHFMSSSSLTVGLRLLSVLDDGDGTARPDHVLSLWRDEGLQDSPSVLQMLDFSLDEPLSLSDLTLALDNELLVSGHSVHQAALICYRTELQHLQTLVEQSCGERDKAKSDLDQVELRNLKLLQEVDDRQNQEETSAQDRIRQVELSCRGRLSALRSQMEQEAESMLQQIEREKSVLQRTVVELTSREDDLQGELCALRQVRQEKDSVENFALDQEVSGLRLRLSQSQLNVNKLHQELERLLLDKLVCPTLAALSERGRVSHVLLVLFSDWPLEFGSAARCGLTDSG
ncbi:ninein-like protein [Eucyclogobius newberryi]|uniref:ninein-like protein n=1 Tax=Eucyclogobius newberryi TaxID=166745 RepID=UPI003B591E59